MTINRRRFLATGAVAAGIAACGERRRGPEQTGVLVVGAGLSGLYAAILLEEQGVEGIGREARDRGGGRLWTLDDVPGAPEAGGRTIDAMYARTLDLMSRLGLERFERRPVVPGTALYVNGMLLDANDWPVSFANPLAGEERNIAPNRLYGWYMDRTNPLSDLLDWRDPNFYSHDRTSIRDALANAGASTTALDYMDVNFDGTGMDDMSALFAYRKQLVAQFGQGGAYRVKGGSSRLPEAMASTLRTEIRFGKIVEGIRSGNSDVEFQCTDGTRYAADYALVSIPFSVLRNLALEPEPDPGQRAIMNTLPYNHITHIQLAFSEPFWEADGLPPSMWVDGPIERILATPDFDRELQTLNVWLNGSGAFQADAMSEEEIAAFYPAELARIRPASAGKVTVVSSTHWGQDPFAQGAYHFWGPGQIAEFGDVARAPLGRVHWIGEHMADYQQGMEGALESAERETFRVLESL